MKISGVNISYDSKEFSNIFKRMFPSLAVLAIRILGDEDLGKDIVQEAFVKLWENKDQEFENENAFTVYMYVLVKNACISQLRKNTKYNHLSIDEGLRVPNQEILNEVLTQETYRLLYKAINELSPQAQEIINLSLKGYKNQDIVDELNISINTVKTVKKRAYQALRNKLGSIFTLLLLIILYLF